VKRSVVLFPVLFSLTCLLAGCGGSPSVERVRWEIQRRFPEARFEPEDHVHLGRISLGLIRGLVRMVPGKVEGQEILNEIHRIDVATYTVHSLPDLSRIQGETHFEERLARAGWNMAIRTREENSRAWIFTRSDEDGGLRNLFVVTLEADELTLVSVDGRLDRALAEAIALEPKEAVRRMKGGGEEQSSESPGS
jgi:uncharacterized protein DUF4252